jgi:hypothetical protein
MKGVMANIVTMLTKLGYFVLQYFFIAVHWLLKFFKIQWQRWQRGNTRRDLDRAFRDLGAEVYALYKGGEGADFAARPVVDDRLRRAEDAEAKVLRVDDDIQVLRDAFAQRREELKARYAAKRDAAGAASPYGGEMSD